MSWPITWYIGAIAAILGAMMGLLSLLRPQWGANVVRLQPQTEKPGGWAEFRASYGGALVLMHAAVLVGLAYSASGQTALLAGASLAAALYWIGMAGGRIVSMLADKSRGTVTDYNMFGTGFELVMGAALIGPALGVILG